MAWSNPFDRDREVHYKNITTYKILTLISFLLNVVVSVYYSSTYPEDPHKLNHNSIFQQSNLHPTPFTLSHVFVSIYWIALWVLQAGYLWHLYSSNEDLKKASTSVGSHFILFNLFQFVWVFLWTRGHFILSELVLVLNFLQAATLYVRNPTTPRFIHLPAVSLTLTWTFFAVMWNGAVMVHCHDLPCRILANIAIWGIAVYAGFFLVVFKDWSLGFATAFLTAGLAVGQMAMKVIELQWIFAFTIMSLVIVMTLVVAVPGVVNRTADDRERAPLLADGN